MCELTSILGLSQGGRYNIKYTSHRPGSRLSAVVRLPFAPYQMIPNLSRQLCRPAAVAAAPCSCRRPTSDKQLGGELGQRGMVIQRRHWIDRSGRDLQGRSFMCRVEASRKMAKEREGEGLARVREVLLSGYLTRSKVYKVLEA